MILGNNSNQQMMRQNRYNNLNTNMNMHQTRNNFQNQTCGNSKNTNSGKTEEKDKQVRMSISFKKDEIWLYDILKGYSCPTGTIKDILKSYFGQS